MSCCGQVKNLVLKGVSVGTKLLFGKRVSKVIQRSRLQICQNCDLFISYSFGPVCGKLYDGKKRDETVAGCGCLLGHKTSLKDEKCPQGKW